MRLSSMKITGESHLDHSLCTSHLAWLLARYGDRTEFFIETVELPDELPDLICELHGPLMGDDPVAEFVVHYARRGGRPGRSRLVFRDARLTRLITVIGGPSGDEPCVLYTAFGGPAAPREPFDPAIEDEDFRVSMAFWRDHALSSDFRPGSSAIHPQAPRDRVG
jgi:hypothetical protein